MKNKKLIFAGVLLAIAIVLPQAFHLTGVPKSGAVFLPMHIPVLLTGFLLGPFYGLILGLLSPLCSSILTGMPAFDRLFFMMGELSFYGIVSGLCYHSFKLYNKKFGITLSLVLAMLAGRAVYAIMLVVAANVFHINCGGIQAVIIAITTGIPGIIIQLFLIPAIVYALKKGGVIREFLS